MFGKNNEIKRALWLKKTLGSISAGKSILDAGAGELRNKIYCSHLEYTSQDLCEYSGSGDSSALQTGEWNTSGVDIASDITSIPRPDSSFDVVLCSEVFEHMPSPDLAVKEFSRLLKENGKLVITAPFCSLTHFAPSFFNTGFSKYWYEHHLDKHNFDIIEVSNNGNWFEYLAQELWRLPWISSKYSFRVFGYLSLLISLPLILALYIMNKLDKGSSEVLCFGYHIVAIKKLSEK